MPFPSSNQQRQSTEEKAVICVIISESRGDLGSLGVADGDQLLSDDRQDFDVDTVEFVKAAPGARLRQTREEPPHHLHTRRYPVDRLGVVYYFTSYTGPSDSV